MGITQTIIDCHRNWKPYEEWEANNQKKYAEKKVLFDERYKNNPSELNKLKQKSSIVLRCTNILDNASENASQNMQVAVNETSAFMWIIPALILQGAILKWTIKAASTATKTKKLPTYFFFLPYLQATLPLMDMPFVFWKTQKQIEASRVARTKAREEELKDIRNFVQYTPEQIKMAKEIAAKMPDKKIDNEDNKNITIKSAFKSILNLDDEYSKYLKQYKEREGIDKKIAQKISTKYTDKELSEAKKDKELILTGVKEINNNAEKYCENAEASFSTLKLFNFVITLPSMVVLNKFLNTFAKGMSKTGRKFTSVALPLAVLFPVNLYLTSKTKEAAKVGRYKAKQNLNHDLSKLAYFDDKELKKVKTVDLPPQNKGIFNKLKRSFKFIPQYLKDREEFLKYKKSNWIEEEKLYNALKTVPITDKQKKDAQHLQEKVFFVFDEMDEMSQKYSEHVEGGIGLAQNIFKIIKCATMITTVMLPLYCLFHGKFPITKLAKKLSDITLKKDSPLRKNINEIYNITAKDKKMKDLVNRSCAIEDNSFTKMLNEPKLQKPLSNILTIFSSNKDSLKSQVKDGKVAKWGLNLVNDLLQIGLNKLSKLPKAQLEKYKLDEVINKFKDTNNKGKTLKSTLWAIAIPALAITTGISYSINSFFAHLQKKSGFIGVMHSINKLDKTEYFAVKE